MEVENHLIERKLILEGPIFHFHDYGRKGKTNLLIFVGSTATVMQKTVVPVPTQGFSRRGGPSSGGKDFGLGL